jgi:hypothetical protein
MFCGYLGQENWPLYLPPPSFVSVPINWFVAVSKAWSVAALLVLVASTRNSRFAAVYSAFVMPTVSVCAGVTVRVADWVTPPPVADNTTLVDAVTALVATVNVALVAPPGTVTLAGTVATAVLLLASVTTIPPLGAGPLRVTVPWDGFPPVTLVGLRLTPDTVTAAAGFTVSVADVVTPPAVAEMVADVEAVTNVVVIVKLALVAPAATVTLAGTVTAAELSESVTTSPPAGAGALRATVPVEELPPTTLAGLTLRAVRIGAEVGFTVSRAVRVTPPNVPRMLPTIGTDTL